MAEDLALEISSPRPLAVCGEGLPVDVELRNEGDEPARVAIGPSRAIVFELRTEAEGPVRHTRSRLGALLEAMGDRSKPLPPDEVSMLAAGESLSVREDPAAGSATPIPAGRYLLTACWESDGGDLVSNEIEIVVEAPAIGHLACLYCPFSGSHAQAFDTLADGDARPAIYQRETGSLRADASVFRRRADSEARDGPVLAVHTAPRLSQRWLGWLQGDHLATLVGPGSGIAATPLTAPVELERTRLAEPALHRASTATNPPRFDWGEGLFHVVGLHDGRTHVQRFVATRQAVSPGRRAPLEAPAGARVLTQWSPTDGAIRFLWSERVKGVTRIVARRFTGDLDSLDPQAEVLYWRHSQLLAMEIEPIARGPGRVHALFGPEGDHPLGWRLVYVQIPLDDREPVRRYSIEAPHAAASAYAISGHVAGGLLVLAKVGDTIWRKAATEPAPWRMLAEDAAAWRQLRLAAAGDGYWAALAVDPARGVVCVPDPDFSRER